MKSLLLTVITVIALAGCAELPGYARIVHSESGKSFLVEMDKEAVSKALSMSVVWSSEWKSTDCQLDMWVKDLRDFAKGESLVITIDGEKYSFTSTSKHSLQNIETEDFDSKATFSSNFVFTRKYLIKREILEKIVRAKKVLFKVNLENGVIESSAQDFSVSDIKPALAEFLEKLKKSASIKR